MRRLLFSSLLFFLFSIIPLTTYASVVNTTHTNSVTNGLVGYWTMDGQDINFNSNKITDRSGQGNSGQLLNMSTSTSPSAGKIGQALTFDKTNDCIDMGNPSALNITGAVTVSAWVRPNSSGLNRSVFSKSSLGGAASVNQYALYDSGSNSFGFQVQNAGLGATLLSKTASSVVPNNSWTHIVGSYNGSDTTKFYVNGAQVDSDTSASYGALNQSGKNAEIGNSNGGSICNSSVFDGLIDDVRVYNRELTSNEVTQLYNLGNKAALAGASRNNRITNGLLLLWSLDGQDTNWGSQTTFDRSGNGRDGTIALMPTSTTPGPGTIGQGFNFNASGQTAGVSSASFAPPAAGFSMSFWMRTTQVSGQVIMGWGNRFARVGGVTTDKLSIAVDGTAANSATTGCSVNDGKWHHIVFTTTASEQNIYCDTVAGTSASETLNTSSAAFVLGKALTGDSLKYTGVFDDVRIYNRILTASEITALYSQGNGLKSNVSRPDRLTNGLIGYWTFDGKDMIGGRANDVSGSGNTAYALGISTTTFYGVGKIGQGLNFDGADDRLQAGTLASNNNFIGTTEGTYTAWVYARGFGGGGVGSIIDNGQTRLRVQSTNSRFTFSSNNFSNTANSANNAVVLNRWIHIAVTRDINGTANIYVNGVLSGSADQNSGTPGATSNTPFIGNNLTTAVGFSGIIDDVRVYNRILSTSEITQLYNLGR